MTIFFGEVLKIKIIEVLQIQEKVFLYISFFDQGIKLHFLQINLLIAIFKFQIIKPIIFQHF